MTAQDAAPSLDPAQALRLLVESGREVVCLLDQAARIRWISPVVERQLGHAPAGLIGRELVELAAAVDRPALAALLAERAPAGPCCLSLPLLNAAGEGHWMEITAHPAATDDPTDEPAAGLVCCWREIGAEVALRHQLERARSIDPLSGLLTRSVLLARLEERLAGPLDAGGAPALLSIGIDRLSQVNDALTHRAGDHLVATLAARLAERVSAPDLVARGTGDSFLVWVQHGGGAAELMARAEGLRQACREPLAFEGHPLEPSVSIGIARAEPARGAEELLRDASLAMRQAAAEGRDRSLLAHPQAAEEPRRTLALQAEIRAALEADAFQAWFMPVVDLASGACCGYEALVRWLRPDGSLLLPDAFLPTARLTNQAAAIDLAVLRQSITALATLPADGFVAANLTPATLRHPDLAATVARWLQEAGVCPDRLHLEITETDLLTLAAGVRQPIEQLAALGVRWLIDDFGTGFSSISHLRDLPIHGIKLDRSFSAAIGHGDLKSLRLAQALAGLAEGLGLLTVAEGVETEAEAATLREFGWQKAQGWLYGKAAPLPAATDRRGAPRQAADHGAAARPAGAAFSRQSWAVAVTDSVPVGLYALRVSAEGAVQFLFLSRRWLEMLRLSKEAVLADAALAFARIHPEDAEAFDRCWRASVTAGQRLLWEGRLQVEDTTSWVRVESIPQLQADGSSIWQGVMGDITEAKQRELDLQRSLDHAPIAIVALNRRDEDPEVTYLNRAFQRTFGYDRRSIPRRSDWARLSFPDPAYREEQLAAWQAELDQVGAEEGVLQTREVKICAADGRQLDVLVSGVALEGVLLVSLLDITQRRQAERQLQQTRSALAETALAITEAIPVGTYTMVLPPDGALASFSFMSDRFLQIAGLEREAALADPSYVFACVHPDDQEDWMRRNLEVFAAKLPFYGETRLLVRGEERWVSAESEPRSLADGSTVWEGVLIDITDRIRAQEELRQEKARLACTLDSLLDPHLLLQAVRNGEREVVDFQILEANAAACRERGQPRGELVGARFRERLPTHGEAGLVERYGAVVDTGEPLALNDYRLPPIPGERAPILDIRAVRVGEVLSCTWRDGAERYAAARQLADSEERYRLLAENSSDVVMQLADDGTIRWVSPSLTAMLGWRPEEWIGRVGTEFLEHRGETDAYRANLVALAAGRSVVARDRIRSRSGRWHWVETHACPFRTTRGEIDGIVAFFRTIDAEVEAETALARQASSDALTGLANRRETFRRLEQLIGREAAGTPPLALAFCDLDRFKEVNDSHGHAAGDALLVAAGERLRAVLRPADLVGRIGGDELLVVLVGVSSLEEALTQAEALRAAVRHPLPIPTASQTVTLHATMSIGVTLSQPGESVDALVARADAALYQAKQAGRDRVVSLVG